MKQSAATLSAELVLLLCFMQAVPARANIGPPVDEPQRTSQQPKAKEVGKDDIDAIGNRDIGGRGLGNWYSLETEIRMGKEYAQMIESTVKLVKDPIITEYVNRIGQNIVRNSDSKLPFTIKVIDADEVNAFALPGGFFYVNSGLLLLAEEEAELAGVMAHEVAHVGARHAMRANDAGQLCEYRLDSPDFCQWRCRVCSSLSGEPWPAHDLPEILSRIRRGGRLSRAAVYVQDWLRPAILYESLREDASAREGQAGHSLQDIRQSPAYREPGRKNPEAARNQAPASP